MKVLQELQDQTQQFEEDLENPEEEFILKDNPPYSFQKS